MRSNLKEANKLYNQKNYIEALEKYNQIADLHPELSNAIKVNIALAQKKIKGTRSHESIENNHKKNEEIDYSQYINSSAYAYISEKISYFKRKKQKTEEVLVSIIMPTRNAEQYIEHSIESLLNQTHRNIEIIVIDDFSEDKTPDIVRKITNKDSRVFYKRVNANLGTYFARSYGISLSKGKYISFQDADDFSHEDRIRLHLEELKNKKLRMVTSNYVRFSPSTGQITKFHEKLEHYGFITSMIEKSIFDEIGSFDITSRGGDAEFSNRLMRFIPKTSIGHISIPTYLATDMPGSLSYGEVNRNIKNRSNALSFPRAKYVSSYTTTIQSINKNDSKFVFKFPMLRTPYSLTGNLKAASIGDYKIVGTVCTIPKRKEIFELGFKSIIDQVDTLYVYPDKYTESEIPSFIKENPKVKILSTKAHPGLRDGAKFLALQQGLLDEELEKAILFTFDDDIYYPPDYVHSLFNRLDSINFNGIVGVHGATLNNEFQSFRTDRKVFHFKKALNRNKLVDVLGTGTVAFKASLMRECIKPDDIYPGLVDISLAVACRRNAIPMHCISRPQGWLEDISGDLEQSTLYDELVVSSKPHTEALKAIGSNAWGETAIQRIFHDYKITKDPSKETVKKDIAITPNDTPRYISIEIQSKEIYKISINFNAKDLLAELALIDSSSGRTVYRRNTINGSASFLCNSSSSSNFKIDLSKLKTKIKTVATVKVEYVIDSSSPSALNTSDTSITACLATYPPRESCLVDVFNSTLPKVDNLCIYLNKYNALPDFISEELKTPEKRETLNFIIDSSGRPKASGKFRWINCEGYIFTLDDDIHYPDDYFSYLVGWIERFNRGCVVGLHGVIFEEFVTDFHSGASSSIKNKFNFSQPLEEYRKVHLLGTGTTAFHSSLFKNKIHELYDLLNNCQGYENINDELLAVFTKRNNISMIAVPRKKNWLKSNEKMKYGIYEEHFNDNSISQSAVSLLQKENPWPCL